MQGLYSYSDTDTASSAWFNTNSSNNVVEGTTEAKEALETQLSDAGNGVVARVIHLSSNYVKVKWFKNGLPVGMYKAKGHTLAKAISALEYYKENKLDLSGVDTIEVTAADDTPTHPTTTQLTVTATLDDLDEVDVTSKSSFVSSDETKATVDEDGLVTTVAAGATTITATYGTNTDDLVVTVA
jgi:hypothetical protein